MTNVPRSLSRGLAAVLLLLLGEVHAQPKNVILFIGDGMDDHQITLARNYLHGPAGRLTLDAMPVRSAVQVLTVDETDPTVPLYVAESAGSGTALATGKVTSRARIATTAGTDKPLETILELAQAHGLRTGVVTTSSVTDATPAVFMAHINVRMCENPMAMEDEAYNCNQYRKSAGGAGSIAEQIAASSHNLILGGGREHFAMLAEGAATTILDSANQNGFTVLTSQEDLSNVSADRLLGLFADEHLPVKLRGTDNRTAEKPDPSLLNHVHWALGDVALPEPMNCVPEPEFVGIPPLRDMTDQALSHLANENGFVLIIESASIDKRAHARDPCGSIGELAQLEDALQTALAFSETHQDTLILVTADHAQAAQIVPDASLFAAFGIPVFTPGNLARINMPSGGIMAVNYATNSFFAEEHTGATVPLFANRRDLDIPTYLTQPEIYQIMRQFLGL